MEKEEKKEKKMIDLLNNRPYFVQRITSASIKARAEKERIKNVTHKVDLYLKNVNEIEKKVGLKVLDDEVKPGVVEKEKLNEIVGRLYKVKKVEKKEKIEKDVRKLDIIKAKSKLVMKNTDIVLPQIMKQENHKYATDLKDAVAKTIKRGKSAFTRAIRKGKR